MQFAIFYFREDRTVEVGKVDSIHEEDLCKINLSEEIKKCPNVDSDEGWIKVLWTKQAGKKKKEKKYFDAKVLQFSDDYSDLCKKREEWCRTGADIWQTSIKRKMKPNNKWNDKEDTPVPKQKKTASKQNKQKEVQKQAANKMIEALKMDLMKPLSEEVESSEELESNEEMSETEDPTQSEDLTQSEDPTLLEEPEEFPRNWSQAVLEIKRLRGENETLKEENKTLQEDQKEIIEAVKELPAIVKQLKKIVQQLPSPATVAAKPPSIMAPTPTPRTSVNLHSPVSPPPPTPLSVCTSPESDNMVCLAPGSDVKITVSQLRNLRDTNPACYVGDLAIAVFGSGTLASSSLTGKQSGAHKEVEAKPALDPTKLNAIIVHATSKYPDLSAQKVRGIISKKCNNIAFASKKK